MSRHRKVKALDYDQEYDDYYGEFDDDDDEDDEDFEKKYLSSVNKQVAKKPNPTVQKDEHKTPRFEYSGKKAGTSKVSKSNPLSGGKSKHRAESTKVSRDVTIEEDFTPEQIDKLTQQYNETLKIKEAAQPTFSARKAQKHQETSITESKTTSNQPASRKIDPPNPISKKQVKSLPTLIEKRQALKHNLKKLATPSAQDLEAFRLRSLQTAKEYDEFTKSTRPRLNLVVVGHVDAGKSTLVGHLLYKLGQISNKQMHRFEVDSQRSGKASFKFAWALDETNEERARGVTIDIALTKFETAQHDVVLLDAPGHVDFIPAVISGAAQADAALLVVDATKGEFETGFSSGGQTREHTFLMRSLGIKSLVVVVNKMDNVNWDWGRYNDIVECLKPFLKQAGFNLGSEVQFIACSGLSGENIAERRVSKMMRESSHPQLEDLSLANFNKMPSLVEAIDRMRPADRMVDKPTRVSITDVFKGMSSGVFLGARIISGKLEPKQKLILLPPNETCEIKQVEVRDSKAMKAFAGDIVTTVATGIDLNKFYRGCILSDSLLPCPVTNRFQARVVMFQGANIILVKGTPVEVHINGLTESGEIRRLVSLLNKNSGELIQKKPRCIVQNSSAIIQLKLDRVVCCELYEDNKELGRFMIRAYGKTIAAGLITKIKTPKLPKSRMKMRSK